MTNTERLAAARTHADLAAIAATLRGAALTAELAAKSLPTGGTAAAKRERLCWLYGARLDSLALGRR